MRIKTVLFSLFAISTLAAGCFVDDSAPDSEADQSTVERGRGGKADADLTGSCKAITHDDDGNLVEKKYCGGQSYGTCWCDDSCAGYGDCCSDIAESCETEPPPNDGCSEGQMLCDGCCGQTQCVDDNPLGCPLVLCVPYCPETCEAAGGTCLSDPNDVTFPAICGALGMSESSATCEAYNQACCVAL